VSQANVIVALRARWPAYDDLHRLNRKLLLMRLRNNTVKVMRWYRWSPYAPRPA
jgi:hypothetical protein